MLQVADEMGHRAYSGPICVPTPVDTVSNKHYYCAAGCADLKCFCGEWLLADGWYVSPFDKAGITVFRCERTALAETRMCKTPGTVWNIEAKRCVPGTTAACEGFIMKGYGYCDVSAIGRYQPQAAAQAAAAVPAGANATADAQGRGSARRLAAFGAAPGSSATSGYQHGRRRLQSFWVEDTVQVDRDVRDEGSCNPGDVKLATEYGCWLPDPRGNWPNEYRFLANAHTLTRRMNNGQHSPNNICACGFSYACPSFLSDNCQGLGIRFSGSKPPSTEGEAADMLATHIACRCSAMLRNVICSPTCRPSSCTAVPYTPRLFKHNVEMWVNPPNPPPVHWWSWV